jgi:hypothetical protein
MCQLEMRVMQGRFLPRISRVFGLKEECGKNAIFDSVDH